MLEKTDIRSKTEYFYPWIIRTMFQRSELSITKVLSEQAIAATRLFVEREGLNN